MADFSAPICILGAGAWGTALALQCAKNKAEVRLWEFDRDLVRQLTEQRTNKRFLPGVAFPDNIHIYSDISAAVQGVRDILLVVPSHAFHSVLTLIKPHVGDVRIAWGTKGFVPPHQLSHAVVEQEFGAVPIAVLSGPTFAMEVARELPTAITVASNQKEFALDMAHCLHAENFRAYISDDYIGVEVGGAVKNVLAIAVGIADGMGFGANARCALITRGLAELARLGAILGGKSETFMGLAGLGDLVLTCTDNQSRNRRFGLAIGQGKDRHEALQEIDQVVEGIGTTKAVYELAHELEVEMPIVDQVYQILYRKSSPREAVAALLSRALKEEN